MGATPGVRGTSASIGGPTPGVAILPASTETETPGVAAISASRMRATPGVAPSLASKTRPVPLEDATGSRQDAALRLDTLCTEAGEAFPTLKGAAVGGRNAGSSVRDAGALRANSPRSLGEPSFKLTTRTFDLQAATSQLDMLAASLTPDLRRLRATESRPGGYRGSGSLEGRGSAWRPAGRRRRAPEPRHGRWDRPMAWRRARAASPRLPA